MSPKPVSRASLIFWTLFGALVISIAFAVSIRRNVDRVLHSVGNSEEDENVYPERGNVAIFEVKGVIMESDEALKELRELDERDDIKAIVVRVSSPGGAVGPTQEIYDALMRMKPKKKLVCSFGDIAASGGYYIGAACDKIVSNSGALTGSIGVIMNFMNLKNLYNWAKVEPFIIKAGKYKDIGSENRPMLPEERALLQEMMDDVHGQFKDAVAKGRHLTRAFVDQYADGRIFSGSQAKKLGFVDFLGGEFEAVKLAGELAGLKNKPKVVRKNSRKIKIRSLFESKALTPALNVPESLKQILKELIPGAELKLPQGVPFFLPAYMFGEK